MSSSDRITSVSALARKLKPYILAWDELGTDSSRAIVVTIPGGSAGGGGGLDYHDLNGPWHTGKLDWSQINFVSSDLDDVLGTMPWARIDFAGSDLDDIGGNLEWARINFTTSDIDDILGNLEWNRINFTGSDLDDIGGNLEWNVINFTGSDIVDIEARDVTDLQATGSQYQAITLVAPNEIGIEDTSWDGKVPGNVLLRSDSEGRISLSDFWTPQIGNPAGSLILYPANDLDLSPQAGDIITMAEMRSDNYVAEDIGISIDFGTGEADFRSMFVDSLYAEEFVALVKRATVGSFVVTPSMALLTRPYTVLAVGQTSDIFVTNIPGVNDTMRAFQPGDHLGIPLFKDNSVASTGDAELQSVTHASGEASTVSATHLDEDFESYAVGTDPTDWKLTAPSNSMAVAPEYWSIFDDSGNKVFGVDGTVSNSNYHAHWDGTGAATLSNYRMSGRFKIGDVSAGVGFTLLSKYVGSSPSDTYVRVRRYQHVVDNADFHVSCHGYADPDGGTTESGFSPSEDVSAATGVWIEYKIEVEDDGSNQTDLRAKFWESGTSEPGSWQIDCYWTGSSRPRTGTFGFWSHATDSGNALYDDLLVESLGAQSGTGLTVETDADLSSSDLALAIVTSDAATGLSVPANWTQADVRTLGSNTVRLFETVVDKSMAQDWTSTDASEMQVVVLALAGVVPDNWIFELELDTTADTSQETPGTTLIEASQVIEVYVMDGATGSQGYSGNAAFNSYAENSSGNSSIAVFDAKQGVGSWSAGSLGTQYSVRSAGYLIHMPSINSSSGSGLIIGEAYGTIQNSGAVTTNEEQAYEFTVTRVTPTQAVGAVLPADSEVRDYGKPGDGFFEATARDGTNNAPWARVATWDSVPWITQTKTQMGKLSRESAVDGTWGFLFKHGTDGTSDHRFVELSDARAYLENVDISMANEEGIWLTFTELEGMTIIAENGAEEDYNQWDAARKIAWVDADTNRANLQIAPYEYEKGDAKFRTIYMVADSMDNFDSEAGFRSIAKTGNIASASMLTQLRSEDNSELINSAALVSCYSSDEGTYILMDAEDTSIRGGGLFTLSQVRLTDDAIDIEAPVVTVEGRLELHRASGVATWNMQQSDSTDAFVIYDGSDDSAAFAIYPEDRSHRIFGGLWLDEDQPLIVGAKKHGFVWDDVDDEISPQLIVGSESRLAAENYLTAGVGVIASTAWARHVIFAANAYLAVNETTGADPFSTSIDQWVFSGQQTGGTRAGFLNFVGNSGEWRWRTGALGFANGAKFGGADVETVMTLSNSGTLQIEDQMGEDWISLSFRTNWQSYSSGSGATQSIASYRRFGDQIFMKGLVQRKNSASADPDVIADLPSAYRPHAAEIFYCPFYSGGTNSTVRVNVNEDGTIKIYGSIAANGWVSFAGMTWPITQ